MHTILTPAVALMLGAAALSQSPLSTLFASNNSGSVGGAVYFDLDVTHPAGITILQIDFNVTNATANVNGTLDVYTVPGGRAGNMGSQAAWTGPNALGNPVLTMANNTPSPCVLTSPVFLPMGNHGVALVANGYANAYTNGNGTNQTWTTNEVTLNAGNADNTPWNGGQFSPRVANVNIHYANGPGGQVFATRTNYGTGCVSQADTCFYEAFGPGTFDLLGPPPAPDSMTLVYAGSSYLAISGLASYVPPSGAATVLNLANNGEATVALSAPLPVGRSGSTSALTVCSNGFVSVAPGNGTGSAPSVSTLLNNPETAWYSWHNYNPAASGGGRVKFEEIAGVAYVTWDGVYDSGLTVPNTLQFQFDTQTGNVSIVWVAISNQGNGHIVGFSEGGATVDPGNSDLSALLPLAIASAALFRIDPLALEADARPIVNTVINLVTSNITPTAPFGGIAFGFNPLNPPIDLSSFGMQGCFQHADQILTLLFFPAGANVASVPLTVPNMLSLNLQVQSFAYDPNAGLTTLGAVSSNAVELMTGDW